MLRWGAKKLLFIKFATYTIRKCGFQSCDLVHKAQKRVLFTLSKNTLFVWCIISGTGFIHP